MYLLIECIDRNLNAERYNTYDEAYYAMKEYYYEFGISRGIQKLSEFEAYKTDAGLSHSYCDWKIMEM